MRVVIACVLCATVFSALHLPDATAAQQIEQLAIQDSAQLVGRKINVNRLPLCEPGTYKGDLKHAGMEATVLSAEPSKLNLPSLQKSVLDKMSPGLRDSYLDQQKAALLLLQFGDGAKRDTCAAVGPKFLAQYIELAPGETLAPVASPVTAPISSNSPNQPVAESGGQTQPSSLGRSAGGAWEIQPQKDKLTDQSSTVYLLNADDEKGYIAFRCSGDGRFEEAWFDPGVVVDNSTTAPRGLLGVDQSNQMVQVRVDNKLTFHSWFVSADLRALTIGKRDLEQILKAKDYRVQFTVAFSGDDVRKFSPSGIDRQLVKQACGF